MTDSYSDDKAAAMLKHFDSLRWPDEPSYDDLKKDVEYLACLLQECAEYVERYSDVSDGSYGEPVPNKAMALCSLIKEALGE